MTGWFYSFMLANTYFHDILCEKNCRNLKINNLDTSIFKVIENLILAQIYFDTIANTLLILVTGTNIPLLK